MKHPAQEKITKASTTPPAPAKALLPTPSPQLFDVSKRVEESLQFEAQLKNKVEALQQTIEAKEDEWQNRVRMLDQVISTDQKENDLLAERVRQSEERNTALTNQFNELYHYCETLYQDADKRRKEIESRCITSEEAVEKMREKVAQTEISQEGLLAENLQLEEQVRELTLMLKAKRSESTAALSSLVRGKECIESATRTLGGFQTSFQAYLESIETHGFTPVSQRTGKLFLEHWNVERENLAKVTSLLRNLLEAATDAQSDSLQNWPNPEEIHL